MSDAARVKITLKNALNALDVIEAEGATIIPDALGLLLSLARSVLRRQHLLLDMTANCLAEMGAKGMVVQEIMRGISEIKEGTAVYSRLALIEDVPDQPVPGPTPNVAPAGDLPW